MPRYFEKANDNLLVRDDPMNSAAMPIAAAMPRAPRRSAAIPNTLQDWARDTAEFVAPRSYAMGGVVSRDAVARVRDDYIMPRRTEIIEMMVTRGHMEMSAHNMGEGHLVHVFREQSGNGLHFDIEAHGAARDALGPPIGIVQNVEQRTSWNGDYEYVARILLNSGAERPNRATRRAPASEVNYTVSATEMLRTMPSISIESVDRAIREFSDAARAASIEPVAPRYSETDIANTDDLEF